MDPNYTYHELVLDSQYATSAFTSAPVKDWPQYTFSNPLGNIDYIKILEVQIPFSFYVINSTNNKFFYIDSNTAISHLITIPVGNYNGSTMAASLATQLSAASSTVFTVEFLNPIQKFRFTSSSNEFVFQFGVKGDHGDTNPRIWLGFDDGLSSSSLSKVLVSPNVSAVTGPNYLYVNSSTIGPLCGIYSEESIGGVGREMAQVPVNCSAGGVIFWQDPDPTHWFALRRLSTLQTIDLFCTLGGTLAPEPMSFNGQGFVIKVGVLSANTMVSDTTQLPQGVSKRIRVA